MQFYKKNIYDINLFLFRISSLSREPLLRSYSFYSDSDICGEYLSLQYPVALSLVVNGKNGHFDINQTPLFPDRKVHGEHCVPTS